MSFAVSQRKLFLNNITEITKLVDELNNEVYDDDQWLVVAQLNKTNSLVDELIDRVWLMIYNKKREKNEIVNISVDKDKDIEGYVNIYNEIVADKIEFVNGISELCDNAIEKKEFKNLKDDVLKLIGNSRIYDVKRKDCKKDNKEKDSDVKRKGHKKDNNNKKDSDDSKNNNDNDNDKVDNDNLIDKLFNNKDKLHNFSDKVLNNLINVAKLKEKILINKEKVREIFSKINIPKKDIRSKLDKYEKINILDDDLINHIWRTIYGENRVNNEIDNIDCDIFEDARRYLTKYIKIVNDKQVLIYSVSEPIDELMEGLDVDTSNDIAVKKIKDLKRPIIKSIEIFNSYIKQDIKKKYIKKKDIEKKDIEKKDIKKKYIKKKDIEKINTKKNSIKHDVNNKPATNDDIKAHIIEKQKVIKQRYKSVLETKKTIKNNIELIYSALKKLPKGSQLKVIELFRLDTILNDSINVIWREIYERDKKGLKKIDVNKIKNVDVFIRQLKIIINNEIVLLKTLVIVKLNHIISDIKTKSKIDDVYNFNDKDKLNMIYNHLDKYMKHLKKRHREYKNNSKNDIS